MIWNRVYVVVLDLPGGPMRQRRWTWNRAHAEKWAARLNRAARRDLWRVEEIRLV